ncbi:MAG TPA: V-type ATP synthase subunit K [Anaerovoracaceae bacterium]|nr:V-type ATP synthase subunit K [Anaerovoracaceae bacterium]
MEVINLILDGKALAIFGAALATLMPGIGSARGMGMVGEAAAGVLAEDSRKFGQCLILQAIPSTQGIYGLLIAFLIMMKIGMVGENGMYEVSILEGLHLFGAALPVAIVGIFAGIIQARVATAGVMVVAKKPQELAKVLILAAMIETYIVLALLVSFLMLNGISITAAY